MWKGLTLFAVTEVRGAISRNVRAAAIYAAAAVLAIGGVVFILHALHYWLALRMGVMQASLIIAGALILIAVVLMLLASSARRKPQRSVPIASSALIAAPDVMKLLGRRKGLGALIVGSVVAAGALAGRYVGRH
jgi:hypothetical protein